MSSRFDSTLAQQMLQDQGFISISSLHELEPGSILDCLESTDPSEYVPGPVIVLGPSTEKEFWDQCNRYGLKGVLPPGKKYYTRVKAE